MSMLGDIKRSLGIDPEYPAFDVDIIMHTNAALMVLTQLGVGPVEGFVLSSTDAGWSDFIGTATNIEGVKAYLYLKVRLAFDPPATSFAIQSMEKLIQEYEWRLNVAVDKGVIEEPVPVDVYE